MVFITEVMRDDAGRVVILEPFYGVWSRSKHFGAHYQKDSNHKNKVFSWADLKKQTSFLHLLLTFIPRWVHPVLLKINFLLYCRPCVTNAFLSPVYHHLPPPPSLMYLLPTFLKRGGTERMSQNITQLLLSSLSLDKNCRKSMRTRKSTAFFSDY